MHGYTNPVIDSDNPDPGVLYIPEADLYLAVTTHGEEGASFPLLTSADLVTWEHQGWVFPAGSRPEYCASSMWAPEIHNVNGRSSGETMCKEGYHHLTFSDIWHIFPAQPRMGVTL